MFYSIIYLRVLICLLALATFSEFDGRSSQLVDAQQTGLKDAARKVIHKLRRPDAKEKLFEVEIEEKKEDKSWEIPHYRVYSRQEYLRPQEVLELLKQLDEFYKNKTDEETNGRNWRIRNLVAASEISHNKCNHQHFTRLDKLAEYNSAYMLNVVPYIKDCRMRQYQFCAGELQELNRIDIEEDLTEEERIGMDIINEKLLVLLNKESESDEPITVVQLPIYMENFELALHEYFHEQVKFDKETTKCVWRLKRAYRREFERVVGDLCIDVTNSLDLTLFMFDEDESIADRLDPIGRQWLTNGRICRFVIGFMKELVAGTYKLAIKKLRPGILGRLTRIRV